jgi:hypothetical protein
MADDRPAPVVLQPGTATVRLTPLGFQEWARQFLQGANSVEATDTFSPVRYFLVCRSIELALKAFLLARGHDKKKLKTLRHDLAKVLAFAGQNALDDVVALADDEKATVVAASGLYSSKRFEYFEVLDAVTGFRGSPDIDQLSAIAAKLVSGVERTCLDAS